MLESGEAAGEKSFYSRNLFWSSSCSRSESCLTDCSLNRERRSTPNTHLANTWMSIASPSILVLILPGEAACVVLLPVGEHSCFQSVQLLVSVSLRFICEFFIFKFNSIFKEVRIHSFNFHHQTIEPVHFNVLLFHLCMDAGLLWSSSGGPVPPRGAGTCSTQTLWDYFLCRRMSADTESESNNSRWPVSAWLHSSERCHMFNYSHESVQVSQHILILM